MAISIHDTDSMTILRNQSHMLMVTLVSTLAYKMTLKYDPTSIVPAELYPFRADSRCAPSQ